jgi:hypothetical protein
MRFRKLRIAWSVVCGIVCVLLIVLWVRSFTSEEWLQGHLIGDQNFVLTSVTGHVNLSTMYMAHGRLIWTIRSRSNDGSAGQLSPIWPRGSHFELKRESDHFDVVAPHCFAVLSFAALAAISWIRRFSLRTLLIGTTLVAVGLGLIVVLSRQ